MRLLHVIPIAKGITKEQLSYFTTKDTKPGAIVFVPLRKRIIPGIVLESTKIENVKTKIRQSSFAMKKVDGKRGYTFLLPAFISAAHKTADFFATTTGSVLHQIIPKLLFDSIESLPNPVHTTSARDATLSSEKLIFEGSEETRFTDYKRIVREEFARNKSLFIVMPTIKEAERLLPLLDKGIEEYATVLHSEIPKKELLNRIEHVLTTKHPMVIVGTPSFLSLPRGDVGTIIVERESARSYKRQSRPYINMRIFAEKYAEELGARIIFADHPLSIETVWKYRQKEYDELSGSRIRTSTDADQYIIDMRGNATFPGQTFSPLSTELLEHTENALSDNKKVFVFNVRRGLAPSTVCEDCGSVVTCNKCNAPVVLHKAKGGNAFLCHSCGEVRSAKERCTTCHSWKLKALGIGVERVKDELAERFGEKRIFAIDSDSTKTYKQARKVATDFYKSKGGILIGTELSLSFLDAPVAVSGIVSLDSLLSIPDARINEHIFSLILRVREVAQESFLLQTRQPELSVIKYATEGNISGFFEKEILERRRFDYPPFSILIKISSFGTEKSTIRELEYVEGFLKKYPFVIYPGFTPLGEGKFALHGLLKVPAQTWPDQNLVSILRSLPPYLSVNVLPTSTL